MGEEAILEEFSDHFMTPEALGKYSLVDCLTTKRRKMLNYSLAGRCRETLWQAEEVA